MKAFYSDHFVLPLPEGHRFPMQKYALLREQVLAQGIIAPEDLRIPEPATDSQILLAHDYTYLEKVKKGKLTDAEMRRIGFPWSPAMVERAIRSVGATINACRYALKEGFAANLAGGTHHAARDHGEGFCVFNDVAIAARTMQSEDRVRRVIIIDCDVHQGNGTAIILKSDPSIFTLSIHGQNNFPFRKHPSDIDIGMPDNATDDEYLTRLEGAVEQALRYANPDLIIYISGADPYKEDRLGRLALTKDGLATRDEMIYRMCQQAGIPVAITMGGGYAPNIQDIVDIHLTTIKVAAEMLKSKQSQATQDVGVSL
jgi:acetoin utilization deacetylase AcuC-like enzyme